MDLDLQLYKQIKKEVSIVIKKRKMKKVKKEKRMTLEEILKNFDPSKIDFSKIPPPTNIRPGRCGGCDVRMNPFRGRGLHRY